MINLLSIESFTTKELREELLRREQLDVVAPHNETPGIEFLEDK